MNLTSPYAPGLTNPRSSGRTLRRLAVLMLAAVVVIAFWLIGDALAARTTNEDPCDLVIGAAREYCHSPTPAASAPGTADGAGGAR
ncbi:hypothetical protein SLUN_00175 [Streptomyces lunaelactis]|uniref:Uncharacterized protein n=1 Tax=Streptomyces lunaelactis TaxID=1535768 RepID=A0A2R4SVM7_9ACTN|nr:hypothetical protein [Streptomyces lunaelactis]AVZ70920.1 hypothetical protein SLUN_00175 [Streptomyces lunaelactis]NUK25176.1 hypothetical protein [Streptomyces lunaelactis]NUK85613.1 hypothetical protein [Streptomyces lunaelactis]